MALAFTPLHVVTVASLGAAAWTFRHLFQLRVALKRTSAEAHAARDIINEMFQEHWAFLTVSTRTLASSLDYRVTLGKIARLAVPDIADSCVVDLLERDGSFTRVERESGPSGAPGNPEIRPSSPLPPESPILDVIRTGRSSRGKIDGEATLVVPLKSRDEILGAITFRQRRPGFVYDSSHQRLAEQIATHAALAIDNSRLYESAQKEIKARERILAVISHDLKNPLSAVDVSAQMLLMSPKLDAENTARERATVENIRHSTRRMAVLIQNLLDVAKIRSDGLRLQRRDEPLNELVSGAVEFARTLAHSRKIQIAVETPAENTLLHVDAEAMFRVFSNLLGNAIKFAPMNSVVTLRAERSPSEITFSVRDTGPGIAPEDLPHIFEDFWQARETAKLGTGLGLPIARGIVQAHGGRLWVESRAGEGADFRFTVPVTGPSTAS
jgi:signal transduction histidine kinase